MSLATKSMIDDVRRAAIELAGVVLRFVLFLLVMKFVFIDWIVYIASPSENPEREREIVRPLEGFTAGPAPATRRQASDLPPNIRIVAPGEPDIILPPIQTHP